MAAELSSRDVDGGKAGGKEREGNRERGEQGEEGGGGDGENDDVGRADIGIWDMGLVVVGSHTGAAAKNIFAPRMTSTNASLPSDEKSSTAAMARCCSLFFWSDFDYQVKSCTNVCICSLSCAGQDVLVFFTKPAGRRAALVVRDQW